MSRASLLVVPVAAAVLAGGCTSVHSLRANVTPELDSTAQSSGQDYNDYARIVDHNTRDAWSDLRRMLLLDRPSMLSPYRMP